MGSKISVIKKSLSKIHYKAIAALLAVALLSSIGGYVYGQSGGSTFTISTGVYPGAASYTIYKEGTTYYAKDAYGVVTSSTDAQTLFASIIASNTTISGVSQGETVITAGVLASALIVVGDGIQNLTISDFTINGNGQNQSLIQINNIATTKNIVIERITFRNFVGSAIGSPGSSVSLASEVTINDCSFKDILASNTTHCINLRATNSRINNNVFISDGSHGGYAVSLKYANNSEISYNYINGLGAGIELWRYFTSALSPSFNNKVIGNQVINTYQTADAYWGINFIGGNGVVANNIFTNLSRDGIIIAGSAFEGNNAVTGNMVNGANSSTTGVGIWVHGADATNKSFNNAVTGNTVTNTMYGIVINYDDNSVVSSNTVNSNYFLGILTSDVSTNTTISNNVVMNNNRANLNDDTIHQFAGINIEGDYNTISGNTVENNKIKNFYVAVSATGTTINGLNTRYSDLGILDVGTNTAVTMSWNTSSLISSWP